jgi:hypothetical protein
VQSDGLTLFRAAGRSALVSTAVSAIGVVFLVLLYVGIFANVGTRGRIQFSSCDFERKMHPALFLAPFIRTYSPRRIL